MIPNFLIPTSSALCGTQVLLVRYSGRFGPKEIWSFPAPDGTRERCHDPADETDRLPAGPELFELSSFLAASFVESKLVLARILRGHRAHAGAGQVSSRVL